MIPRLGAPTHGARPAIRLGGSLIRPAAVQQNCDTNLFPFLVTEGRHVFGVGTRTTRGRTDSRAMFDARMDPEPVNVVYKDLLL